MHIIMRIFPQATTVLWLLAACHAPPPVYIIDEPPEARPVPAPPPAPRAERPSPWPPSADAIWQEGYWHYDPDATDYRWVEGQWAVPEPGLEYVPVSYFVDGGSWYYRPCYWRPRHRRPSRHHRGHRGDDPIHTASVPHHGERQHRAGAPGPDDHRVRRPAPPADDHRVRRPAPPADDHRVRRPAPPADDHRVRRPAPPADEGAPRAVPPARLRPRQTVVLHHGSGHYRTDVTGAIVLGTPSTSASRARARRTGPLRRRAGVMTVTLPRRASQRPTLRDNGETSRTGWRPSTPTRPRPVVSTTPPSPAARRPTPRANTPTRAMIRPAPRTAPTGHATSTTRRPRMVLGPARVATPRARAQTVAPRPRRSATSGPGRSHFSVSSPHRSHGFTRRSTSSGSSVSSPSSKSSRSSTAGGGTRRHGAGASIKSAAPKIKLRGR